MSTRRTQTASRPATLEDLYHAEGKAELIGGRIVHLMATGSLPGQVALDIAVSLRLFTRDAGQGVAYGDNVGFAVPRLASGRESFSPDAAYYDGPLPANPMRFINGPPTFAAEVRSESDYGPAAERQVAAKRADYFEAGTLAVWDVDILAGEIRAFTSAAPDSPRTFQRGDIADAEPAVPGWRIAVNDLLR